MKSKNILSFVFTLVCFSQSRVFSATVLQWRDILTRLQDHGGEISDEIQSARHSFEAVVAETKKSYSGFFPKLTASLYENETNSSGAKWARNYGAQLNLNQNLFTGFADSLRMDLAQSSLRLAEANYDNAMASIRSDLLQAFAVAVYANKFKLLTESILKRRHDNLANVQLQYQGGRENKGSVLLSESYVEQALYDDLQAQHNKEIAVDDLKRMLGIAASEDVEFQAGTDFGEFENNHTEALKDLDTLVAQHPEMRIQEAQVKSSYSNYKIDQSNFYPSMDFNGTYGYLDSKFFPEPYHWSVGFTLTIPLFDGGKDFYSTKSDYAKYLASQNDQKSKRQTIKIKIKSAYNNYLEAQQKEKVDLSFLKASEVRAQIARNKYKNGLMPFDDWDLIENDLIQRQKTSLVSQRDRIIKLAQWQQAQGLGVFNEKR